MSLFLFVIHLAPPAQLDRLSVLLCGQDAFPLIRNLLCGVSVASLLILGIGSRANSANPKSGQAQSEKQTQQPTKSVAGKVAAIGSGGTSFTLDTGQNTLDFVVDKNTQVKGQVKQGTAVTVEYQAMANGQLLAASIMAQA